MPAAVDARRALIDPENSHLNICRKCKLIGLNRSTYYPAPATELQESLRLMRLIDEHYLKTPFYGSRRMAAALRRRGEAINRKRVRRLMTLMGLEGLHPGRRTTIAAPPCRKDTILSMKAEKRKVAVIPRELRLSRQTVYEVLKRA